MKPKQLVKEKRECKYWKLDKNRQLMLCVITYEIPVKKAAKKPKKV